MATKNKEDEELRLPPEIIAQKARNEEAPRDEDDGA